MKTLLKKLLQIFKKAKKKKIKIVMYEDVIEEEEGWEDFV